MVQITFVLPISKYVEPVAWGLMATFKSADMWTDSSMVPHSHSTVLYTTHTTSLTQWTDFIFLPFVQSHSIRWNLQSTSKITWIPSHLLHLPLTNLFADGLSSSESRRRGEKEFSGACCLLLSGIFATWLAFCTCAWNQTGANVCSKENAFSEETCLGRAGWPFCEL